MSATIRKKKIDELYTEIAELRKTRDVLIVANAELIRENQLWPDGWRAALVDMRESLDALIKMIPEKDGDK